MAGKTMRGPSLRGLTAAALLLLAAGSAPSSGTTPDAGAEPGPGTPGPGTDGGTGGDGGTPAPTYSATIRWTAHGIPHITAQDYGSLGYGYGYAFAQENLCVLAEELVTVNARRSEFFGPDASYQNRVKRAQVNNLKSDFFWQSIRDAGTVEQLLALPPPLGPSEQVRAIVRGYAAGYNRYLADTGVDKLEDVRCRGAAWVRPITEMDLYRRYYQLSLLASSGYLLTEVVDAQPPGTSPGGAAPGGASRPLTVDKNAFPTPESLGIGSNAIALGSEATANGRGMVLGNPHFPWYGPERFYQVHLTIPGELNVSGVSLFGAPVVLIGHNDNLAWSHTVSTGYRFTPFELKLVPGNPTAYVYEGQARQMTTQTVTVQARKPDGTLEPRTHTFYRTHFGPMIHYPGALMPWSTETGYAIRDANATNLRVLDQFLAMDKAQSVEELRQAQDTYQAIPWVNTIAADSQGNAYYADSAVVPHVTNAKIDRCVVSPVGRAVYQSARLPVLDGSRKECEWGEDEDAVEPGIFGPKALPRLLRRDYVTNSNDSYWLSNPKQPLTGYPRIIGDEGTVRTLRTRLGLKMVEQRLSGTDGLEGRGFTLDQLQTIAFNNRNNSAELLRSGAVEMCQRTPLVTMPDGVLVDVSEACPILKNWDTRGDLDSPGAVLWREFARRAVAVRGGPFLVPFSASDPVNTPHTLNQTHPEVVQALGAAVRELRARSIPLDASLRTMQFARRDNEAIPIHGCGHVEGCFNYILAQMQPSNTYEVIYGSSFVMAVNFTDAGPVARSILTYSQSSNLASPYASDQTRMFSEKQWVSLRFSEQDIGSDPTLRVKELSE